MVLLKHEFAINITLYNGRKNIYSHIAFNYKMDIIKRYRKFFESQPAP